MYLWNPGGLPEELSVEKLKGEHSSYPRNKNIANVFFMAGYIESWGRGTNKIINSCLGAGLPEPIISEEMGGVSITFLKDIYTEDYLRSHDLNERQIKAVLFIKENEKITNKEYQKINFVGKTLATEELRKMAEAGIILHSGTKGRGSKYTLMNRIGR